MQVATTGLVLRQVKVGEADRILTILTPDLGVVSASARGSLRMKSALFSATGLFCYSEFTLTSGRSHYFVDTAQVKKVFHGISASIEGMALASYMAEIAAELSPAPPEADAQLRLLLNCLYMISERHYPCAQLKAIYELRALTLAGYMPDVLACAGCGKYDGESFTLTLSRAVCSAPIVPKKRAISRIWTTARCTPCAISAWPRIKSCSGSKSRPRAYRSFPAPASSTRWRIWSMAEKPGFSQICT